MIKKISHPLFSFIVLSCLSVMLGNAANPDDYYPVSLRTYAVRGALFSSLDYPRISNNPGKWNLAVATKMKTDFFNEKTASKTKLVSIFNANKLITKKQLADSKIDFKKQKYTIDNADQANFVNEKYYAGNFAAKTEVFTFANREIVTIQYDDNMETTIKNDGLAAIRQGLALLNKFGIQPRVGANIPIKIELAKWKNEYKFNPNGELMQGALKMADNEAFHMQDPMGRESAKIIHTPVFLHLKKGSISDPNGDPMGETIGDRVLIKFVKDSFFLTTMCTNLRILRAKYTVIHEMMHVLHRVNSGDLFWELRPYSQMKFAQNDQVLKLVNQVSEYAAKREAPALEVFAELGTWLIARLNGDLDGDIEAYFKSAWAEYGGNNAKAWPLAYSFLQVQDLSTGPTLKPTSAPTSSKVSFDEKLQAITDRGCTPEPSLVQQRENSENNKIKLLLKQRKNVLNPV